MAILNGDAGDNFLDAPNGETNTIEGKGGADDINGGWLRDIIYGGAGDDVISAEHGADYVSSGNGDDEISAGGGDDYVSLADGRARDVKTVFGHQGDDTFYAGAGRDLLDGGAGQDVVLYENAAAVTVDLQRGVGGRGAAGDTYRSIEDVFGSVNGDRLIGNGAYNDLFGSLGHDLIRGGAGGDYLDGYDGLDTLDYRTSDAGVAIDLATGRAHGGDAQGDQFAGFENVHGSDHGDQLLGDADGNLLAGFAGADRLLGKGGADDLRGGADDDVLNGGAGRDSLTGGVGADVFQFRAIGDSGVPRAQRDIVEDFARDQGDRISLRAVDADTGADGNQRFDFIGDAAFGGASGELRYAAASANAGVIVSGDVDGDGGADFSLFVDGVDALRAGDFLL